MEGSGGRLVRSVIALAIVVVGIMALTGSRVPIINYRLNQCSLDTVTTRTASSGEATAKPKAAASSSKATATTKPTAQKSGGASQHTTTAVTTKKCEPLSVTDPLVLAALLAVIIVMLPAFSELSFGSIFSVKLRQQVDAATQAAGDAKSSATEVSRKVDNLMLSISSSSASSRAASVANVYLGASQADQRIDAADNGDNASSGAAASALFGIFTSIQRAIGDDPVVTLLRWSTTHQVLVPYQRTETTDPIVWLDPGSRFAKQPWVRGLFHEVEPDELASLDTRIRAVLRDGHQTYSVMYVTPVWRDRHAGDKYGLLVVATEALVSDAADIMRVAANQVGIVFERLIAPGAGVSR